MDSLEPLHRSLEQHFESLRLERDARGGKPLFALEHGLDAARITDLRAAVRGSIRAGRPSRKWWLPYIVYAAEVGYRYTGEEYWQTFETTTPGWVEYGDRHYIRQRFRTFADRFGGASPTGPWASHFSIICWPITHAVVPTDLQIQLARLLYEYRYLLSSELLASPGELGEALASRTWKSSSRFQNFAQNTELLGQVAAALLLDEERSSLLLDSTLARIVADLSAERHARRWLADAKRSALRVSLRGLSRASTGARNGATASRTAGERPLKVTDPRLLARHTRDGTWEIHLALPDLSPLVARFPELREVLRTTRCRLAGRKRPLASGQVMYPDQQFRLETWPGADAPLLSLERHDARYDAHLADECRIAPGPTWLFRISDDGIARESRGKTIRPGRRYLMVAEAPAGLPTWATRTSIDCEGLYGYEFEVPTPLDLSHLEVLQALGVTLVSDVELRPVGLVPAAWDMEGEAEWVIGDLPLLALSSSREVETATLSVDTSDAEPVQLPGSALSRPTYLALRDLDSGIHRVRVTVVPTGQEAAEVEGALLVTIREPTVRGSAGTYREPLLLRASPAQPTLEEVWDGQSSVEVVGPTGVGVKIKACLEGVGGSSLVSKTLPTLSLPVESEAWRVAFTRQFKEARDVHRHYDDATALALEVSHPELGSARLRCERRLAPLRWGVGRSREGPFVRLHDNVGASEVSLVRYDFAVPNVAVPVSLEAGAKVQWPAGGLFVARVSAFETAVVLPPLVRDLTDLQRLPEPRVRLPSRSVDGVLELLRSSSLWATASLPGDPFAASQRAAVLRALTTAICCLVGGLRWARAEASVVQRGAAAFRILGEALGDQPYQRALRSALEQEHLATSTPMETWTKRFAALLRGIGQRSGVWRREDWAAEWLLRLASSPASALEWVGPDVREAIRVAVESPAILRAARYLVLATQAQDGGGGDAEWEWR